MAIPKKILNQDITKMTDEELVRIANAPGTLLTKKNEVKNELLRRHKTFLDFKASAYRSAAMPIAAIKAEAYKVLLSSIGRFDPRQGVKFKTFLESSVRKINRFVAQNKSIARIPEQKGLKIQTFEATRSALSNLLGREPSALELADHLKWSLNEVEKMEEALSRRVLSEEETYSRKMAPGTLYGDAWNETREFLYYELDPMSQLVFDYSEGAHGKKVLKADEIAKKLNTSIDKVYAIRRQIDAKLEQYMR